MVHKSDYPTTFSHELAGVITNVGSDVSNFNIGDRVVGFCFDKFATYQRTPATLVHKITDNHSFQVSVDLLRWRRELILEGGCYTAHGLCCCNLWSK